MRCVNKDNRSLLVLLAAIPFSAALKLPENAKTTFPSWFCTYPNQNSVVVRAKDLQVAIESASVDKIEHGIQYLHGPLPANKDLIAYFTYQPSIAPNNAIAVSVNVVHANVGLSYSNLFYLNDIGCEMS